MWTDWRFYAVLANGFIGPLLVVVAAVWVMLVAVEVGAVWVGLVIVAGCLVVLRDIFTERAATYRQGEEIERLRAKINDYDLILEAEEE